MSRIWIRVLESIYRHGSSGPLPRRTTSLVDDDLRRKWENVRSANGSDHTGIPDFDGDDGVEFSNCLLERYEQNIFVGEDSEIGPVAVA